MPFESAAGASDFFALMPETSPVALVSDVAFGLEAISVFGLAGAGATDVGFGFSELPPHPQILTPNRRTARNEHDVGTRKRDALLFVVVVVVLVFIGADPFFAWSVSHFVPVDS